MRLHREPKPVVLHVMGPTCAGKSTLLRLMKERFKDRVALVEVGKALRSKYLDPESPHYDPDHFKGQAAPQHTQGEAWSIYVAGVKQAVLEGVPLILVDGQPRDLDQVAGVFDETATMAEVAFLVVEASHNIRQERLRARCGIGEAGEEQIQDLESYNLGVQRLDNDYKNNYRVLVDLNSRGVCPKVLNTTNMPIGEDGLHVLRGTCITIWNTFVEEN